MLSEDQTDDQPERSESGTGTPAAALPETVPAAPVVTAFSPTFAGAEPASLDAARASVRGSPRAMSVSCVLG